MCFSVADNTINKTPIPKFRATVNTDNRGPVFKLCLCHTFRYKLLLVFTEKAHSVKALMMAL